MATFNDAEGGLSVRTKINAAIVKTDFLTVTQAVDLDAIEARVNALDAAVILKGAWSAAAGTFPGAGAAQAGESWIVSVAGTVNGIDFAIGDRIIAILDNASTATFANNWLKADYTDQVSQVVGLTGSVTAAQIAAAIDTLLGNASWRKGGEEAVTVAVSDEATDLVVGTGKITFRMPFAMTVTSIRASVNVASTGSVIQVDVNANAASMFSTPLTIDATEKTSVTAAVPAVLATTTLADDAEVSIDIDAVGSTTPGKGLKVTLLGRRT